MRLQSSATSQIVGNFFADLDLMSFYHVFNHNFLTNTARKLRNISDCRQFLCGSVFFKCKNTGRFLFWSRAFPVAPFWSRLFGRDFLVASFWSLLLRLPEFAEFYPHYLISF